MPEATQAIAELDPADVAAAFDRGEQRHDQGRRQGGALGAGRPVAGDAAARRATSSSARPNYAVALRLDLDEELLREGAAREVVHAIQIARKGAGLQVEDRIDLTLCGDDALLDAVREHADYVAGETLAASLTFDGAQRDGAHTETARIDGSELGIALRRAG